MSSNESYLGDMLTVAHVKDNFLPESETFIYTLLRALCHCRSIILDRHARQNESLFPFDEHYSPVERFGLAAGVFERMGLRLLGASPYLERVVRTEQVRLIHAHFGQLGALFVPVARRRGLPLVTSFHGVDISVFAQHPAWRRRFRSLWEYGCRFLVVGPVMKERLKATGCPGSRIEVLPLPLDLRRFTFVNRSEPKRVRDTFGQSPASQLVGDTHHFFDITVSGG